MGIDGVFKRGRLYVGCDAEQALAVVVDESNPGHVVQLLGVNKHGFKRLGAWNLLQGGGYCQHKYGKHVRFVCNSCCNTSFTPVDGMLFLHAHLNKHE